MKKCGDTSGTGTGPYNRTAELIRNIKSYTTTLYRKGVYQKKWPRFHEHLWQRSYHDHVIRSAKGLERIRQYILNNPLQWGIDQNNPDNIQLLSKKTTTN